MPRKRPVKVEEAPEEIKQRGGMYAASDFEQAWTVDVLNNKGQVIKVNKFSVSLHAGDEFILPDGWQRDVLFEETGLLKSKPINGIVFLLPNGKRTTLPVKEA